MGGVSPVPGVGVDWEWKVVREIAKTRVTPYILMDEERGYLYIRGESFPMDGQKAYGEVMLWLERCFAQGFEQFTFDCELSYFNCSTAKLLLDMFTLMDRGATPGRQVTVNWITTPDNRMNLHCGEEFSSQMQHLSFHLVVI